MIGRNSCRLSKNGGCPRKNDTVRDRHVTDDAYFQKKKLWISETFNRQIHSNFICNKDSFVPPQHMRSINILKEFLKHNFYLNYVYTNDSRRVRVRTTSWLCTMNFIFPQDHMSHIISNIYRWLDRQTSRDNKKNVVCLESLMSCC